MIVIYLNPNQPKDTYDKKLKEIIDTTEVYHFGEITVITERNPTVIRDMLQFYKPYQFIVPSISDFEASPTMVSELILYAVSNLNISVTLLDDNLHFNTSNALDIYPKVFEHFKTASNYQ